MSSEERFGLQVAQSTQLQRPQQQSSTQQFRQKTRRIKSGLPWLVQFVKDDVRLYFSPLTAIVREFRHQIKS